MFYYFSYFIVPAARAAYYLLPVLYPMLFTRRGTVPLQFIQIIKILFHVVIQPVIQCMVPPVYCGLLLIRNRNPSAPGQLFADIPYVIIHPGTHSGQDCNSVSRSFFLLQLDDIAAIQSCHDAPPNRALASASADLHIIHSNSEIFKDIVAVCQGICNTFHDGPE